MRVLVRGGFIDTTFILCIVFGFLGIAGGVFTMTVGDAITAGLVIIGIGGGLLVLGIIRFIVLSGRRLWLEDLEEGQFTLSDKRRTVELVDTELLEMTTKVSVVYENGLPKSGQRITTLLVDAPEFPTELDLSYKWPLKKSDPLVELFERWHTTMMAKAEEELQTSGVIVGTNWSLTRDDVSYQSEGKAKADEESVPVRGVAAAEIVDRNVCLWADGEDLPFLKVPLGTPNAIALLVLVNKFITGKPASVADGKGLGRVIFERNAGWTKGAIFGAVIFGLILIAVGLSMIVFQIKNPPASVGMFVLAGGLILFGIGLPLAGWYQRTNLLRCHERGLHRNVNGKVTELRYEDIRSFTYTAVRHYYNGAYTGTIVSLTFTSYDGASTKYTATFKNADDELDNLRDHVSRVMAGTMLKKLEAGQDVPWTDEMTFEPDGVDIRGRKGVFGKTKDQFLEWGDIDTYGMNQGQFAIYAYGEKKPVYQTTVSQANFFPGFYLFLLKKFPAPVPEGGDPRKE
jgi:protein-S-isoprenylcysteine O-methyltransferase Ste14